MSAAVPDAELIGRVASGSEDALAALYDRYGAAAYGLALRIVRDATLAEDAVQEAFLAVWRGAARFDPARAQPSTWLFSLVHHKAVDVVRREEARPAMLTETVPDAPSGEDVARDVAGRAQRNDIQIALGRLPDAQREVLELAYFGGYTQSELADRLGEPIGTVKSRTHAALAKLRGILEDAET